MRYRDQNGQDWADIIDFLTMYPDARRRITRILGVFMEVDDTTDLDAQLGVCRLAL